MTDQLKRILLGRKKKSVYQFKVTEDALKEYVFKKYKIKQAVKNHNDKRRRGRERKNKNQMETAPR